jgi:hypothetical protein
VTAHTAIDEAGVIGKLIDAVAVRLDLTVAFHRIQATHQDIDFVAFDLESSGDCLCVKRVG